MNRLYWYIRGYCRLKIEGVATDRVLNRCVKRRIPFWNLHRPDEFTLCLCVFSTDVETVKSLVENCLCETKDVAYVGIQDTLIKMIKRPVLLLGLLLSFAIVLVSQNYLLFFDVTGSENVPDEAVLRALDTLDIGFGISGPKIKPKRIKDHILSMMPQLQWITITQNGCMAQVVIRERPETPKTVERRGLANIIASKSGMITEQSVFEGQAMKAPGDFVGKGEMLVSGVVDLETKYIIVRAQAEIYGKTWYHKKVATPEKCLNKEPADKTSWCIWLEIGKRRIKIFGNSRIYDADCDKMISRRNITLPGGHKLPIAVMIERQHSYNVGEMQISADSANRILQAYAEDSVSQQLCAGRVLSYDRKLQKAEGCHLLDAMFVCHEMIAETVEGKWNKEDFQHD